ncbi:MAG: Cyclic 2,3-diphosphoglycerate synthetase [bacterium ADurb.Bin363]|nr:MAG: Cyclic 2,3-diphosphoglycerate synthetase [bacterium ADurb.Bin363]
MNKGKTLLLLEGSTYIHTNKMALTYAQEEIGDIRGAVILGSIEKTGSPQDLEKLEIPIIYDKNLNSVDRIKKGLETFHPQKVYDFAGAPTVSTENRHEFASIITSSGAVYEGIDFTFTIDRPELPLLRDFILHRTNITTLCFLGTGQRVGKTSVINSLGKYLEKYRPVFITMGRSGPVEPGLISPNGFSLNTEDILELSKKEGPISSDNWQTALSTGFPVIECFRVGEAYRTGVAAFSNVWAGTEIAETLDPELIIYQGSGISRPPVKINGEIVIIGADQNPDKFGKIERYSIIKADMIIITKCDTPENNREKLREFLNSLVSTHLVIETVFKPCPILNNQKSLKGKNILFFTTSPLSAIEGQKDYLEKTYECNIVNYSNNLANREMLSKDLKNFSSTDFDIVLTEFKAAAIMVIEEMKKKNKEVFICENELIPLENYEIKSGLEEVIGMAFARNG